jgi:putative ABC transport system permease protein
MEIVGVVADTRNLSLKAETVPDVYVPYWQWPMQSPILVVRTAASPTPVAPVIRSEAKAVNKSLPLLLVRTMDEILADSVAQPRDQTILVGLFGIAGLILAATGVYGVTSYLVSQRTHEMGIRMVLGATRRDVLGLAVSQGLKLTIIGIGFGILGALGVTSFLSTSLYGVKPADPLTYFLLSLLLTSVALIATYIPARRMTKVDPMVALRYE